MAGQVHFGIASSPSRSSDATLFRAVITDISAVGTAAASHSLHPALLMTADFLVLLYQGGR